MERRVFELIVRRVIAVFYPDCKFATTTVLGEVASIEFKATGKQILEPGWRIIFGIPSAPVSYTHLDVYKRQEQPHGMRGDRLLCG